MKAFRILLGCVLIAIAIYIIGVFGLVWLVTPKGETFSGSRQPAAVVKVKTHFSGHQDVGTGSLIAPDRVLTCFHNIRDARKDNRITVTFRDGLVRECEVLKTDPVLDLALFRIKPVLYLPYDLGDIPEKGNTITICGFPRGMKYAEVTGKMAGRRCHTAGGPATVFLVDETCIQGMSGGPALDSKGRQVGVLFGSNVYSNVTDIQAIRKFLIDEE